jgi:hypothetical protein
MANHVHPEEQSTAAVRAREGAEQLKERAVERVEAMKEGAATGKAKLSERMRRIGSAIQSAGDEMRGEDETWSRVADRLSERFERAANYVRRTEPKQAMRDVESFARREPALFFGGAFLLGLAAGRLLKGSDPGEESASFEREPAERERAKPTDTWAGSTLEGEIE